ncbi:MAG: MFS transporter [Alphaproteobacteria bacterium]|jgi:MFS family permease|nr:MFS transporter [Alphaproteobacteria bacterium]
MLANLARDPWLGSVVVSRMLMTTIFMTYAACLTVLLEAWDMTATEAGTIAGGFHFGYMISLVVFSWLADKIGASRVFLVSASLSGITALLFALFAESFLSGLVLFTLVALSQGGTYYPAIMLISDRYPSERRGGAMGWLIAGTSLGYALSLGLAGWMLAVGGYKLAFLVTAGFTLLGSAIALIALRRTPNVIHAHERDQGFVREIATNGPAVKLVGGYTFHSWELLGMWAWMPAFLAASLAASGSGALAALAAGGAFLSAGFHIVGFFASSTMGQLSDRLGRRTVLLSLAAASTVCSFAIGWMVALPIAVVAVVGAIYAFTSLGDSPVLSTAITEVTRPAYLGSTLAVRGVLGFGAGAIAPLVFGMVIDATNPAGQPPTDWGWAFVVLGLGGLLATICAYLLPRGLRREEPR